MWNIRLEKEEEEEYDLVTFNDNVEKKCSFKFQIGKSICADTYIII